MRRRRTVGASGWTGRLAGVVLCAFFGLGVLTGLAAHEGRLNIPQLGASTGAIRAVATTISSALAHRSRSSAVAMGRESKSGAAAIAIVERNGDFFALLSTGALRGPLAPDSQGDLPILGGDALDNATGAQLLDYAGIVVRAEAQLGQMISELRVSPDGTGSLFLNQPRAEIVIDTGHASAELEHAAWVFKQWRGRESAIAMIDLTVPDRAIVRLHAGARPAIKVAAAHHAANPVAR